ncbi:MAG: DUF3795 domain-containing protein [Clostridia bacterium]|nr:DUF3795 domain-containing protein [Clostridia bacterium]
MSNNSIGKCGFYCGSCPTYINKKCLGCLEEHQDGDCYTRDCVIKKGLDFCGKCEDFPCNELFIRPKSTVLSKNWLKWKQKERGKDDIL